ncbi:MAG: Rieske 2Fe-2S domain-containing protein [bacterium]
MTPPITNGTVGCGPGCGCAAALPRRAFLQRGALGAIGALVASACGDGVIGGTYPTDPFPTTPLSITLADYPALAIVGGAARVDGGTAQPVAVIRTGAASFAAMSLVCPHQGATVDITDSGFRCPSHLAEFAVDGTWSGGKQTGDLTALGVTYDAHAGIVTIDGPASALPPAHLLLAPTSEVFGAVQGQASPAAQTVSITNAGGGTLSGLGTQVGYGTGQRTGWLAATLDTTTAPATMTLKPSTSSLPAGAYAATVQVTTGGAANAPLAVSVSLLVSAAVAPVITLGATSLSFTGVKGSADPAGQTVAITNGASGTLSALTIGTIAYGAAGSGWLAATLSTTTAPATLTVTSRLGTLAAGTYTATVPVTAAGASNTPQQVAITLVVTSPTGAATLALSSATAAFSAAQGGGTTPAQSISVLNAGGGTLRALALGAIAYGAGGTGWLAASLSASAVPATITLSAAPSTLAPGTYTATVPVTSAGIANSPQSIAVTLTVTGAASLVLSTASATFSAPAGANPGGQIVNITSGGAALSGVALSVAYGAGASGWLSTSSLSATTTPSALTLRVVSSALATGSYTATVTIAATGASSKSIAVTLTVAPAGLAVVIANWPALANVGGIAGSVGTVQGTPTAVVRTGANSFVALSMRCTHQGTTIQIANWKNTGSAFHCPNHDALFDAAGKVLAVSPQKTTPLVARTVNYVPGATTLYVT